ncbi:MAG: HlyC/CorC family transporter [Clostridia bacterium]|nr:HlyC/CorC family transporter [Clostridia bacterium]
MDSIPRCILLIALIIAGGFFSGAETAYSYCNKIRMKTMAEEGHKGAARVVRITDEMDKAITTNLILINVLHVLTSAIATMLALSWMADNPSLATFLETVILTLLVFFFSETLPKAFCRDNADAYAIGFSPFFYALMVLLTPLSFLFIKMGEGLKKIFVKEEEQHAITEDEFSEMVEKVEDEGVLEPEESAIIQSAVEFSDRTVGDIFTPADKVVAIDKNWDRDEILEVLRREQYSRVPVYDRDPGHILGILQVKEYLTALINETDEEKADWRDYLRPAYTVKPEMTLNALFESMGRRHTHMALVVNQRQAMQGLVTMEDLLEELVGEIYDEDEVPEETADAADSGQPSAVSGGDSAAAQRENRSDEKIETDPAETGAAGEGVTDRG